MLRKLTYVANIFLLVMFAVAQQPAAPVAHPEQATEPAGRLLATTVLILPRSSGGVMHLLRSRSARSNPDDRSASPLRRMTGTLG